MQPNVRGFYEVSILSLQYSCFPFLLLVVKSPLNTSFTTIFKWSRSFIATDRSEFNGTLNQYRLIVIF